MNLSCTLLVVMASFSTTLGYSSIIGDSALSRRRFVQSGLWVSAAALGANAVVAADDVSFTKDEAEVAAAKAARLKEKIAASKQNYRKADDLFSQR